MFGKQAIEGGLLLLPTITISYIVAIIIYFIILDILTNTVESRNTHTTKTGILVKAMNITLGLLKHTLGALLSALIASYSFYTIVWITGDFYYSPWEYMSPWNNNLFNLIGIGILTSFLSIKIVNMTSHKINAHILKK